MKKWIVVWLIASLVLVLTACGSTKSAEAAPTASTELSQEGKLLVGTLKLESTDLAVTSGQADLLLPLWQTLSSLESSGTAADQEIDAVVSQIEGIMSAGQLSTITAMDLTEQDLAAAIGNSGASAQASASDGLAGADSPQFQAGGGAPGGGNPPADMGGGAMPASAGTGVAGQIQAQAGTTQAATTTMQVSPALIDALVEILKAKTA